jgi:hypothetical protein
MAHVPKDTDRSRFRIPNIEDKLRKIATALGLRLQQVVALLMAIKQELIGTGRPVLASRMRA